MDRARLPQEIIDRILFYLAPAQLYGDPHGSKRSFFNAAAISKKTYNEAGRILRRDVVITILRNGTFVTTDQEPVLDQIRSLTLEIRPWSTYDASPLGLLGSFKVLFRRELQWFRRRRERALSYKNVNWAATDSENLGDYMPGLDSSVLNRQKFLQEHSLNQFLDKAIKSCCRFTKGFPESMILNAIGCWTDGPESNFLDCFNERERDDFVKLGRDLSQAIAHYVLRKYLKAERPDFEAIKFSKFPVALTTPRFAQEDWLMPKYLRIPPTGLKRLHIEFCFQDYRHASKDLHEKTMQDCRTALVAIPYPICLQLSLVHSPETPARKPCLLDCLFDGSKIQSLEELVLQGWYLNMSTLRLIVAKHYLSRLSLERVTFFSTTESAAMDSLCFAKPYSQNQNISVKLFEISTCMRNGSFYAAPSTLSPEAIHFIKETVFSSPQDNWARKRHEYIERFPIAMTKGETPISTTAWYRLLRNQGKRPIALCPECMKEQFPSREAFIQHWHIDHR
ncbi:MAG: hypothetical protein Q9165_002329 [Trypethelium subeluteriae]